MRVGYKGLVSLAIVLGVVVFSVPSANAQGLTISPATLTLNLAPGATERAAEFSVRNSYHDPVNLHFSFEPASGNYVNNIEYLRIEQNEILLRPGQTIRQKVFFTDDPRISPGSQLANLIITQQNATGSVGVVSSVRMPLILVKEDGAVHAIGLAAFSTPRFGFTIPHSLPATIHNTGNMIVIPRGFITISDPSGKVVQKGVLNVSSQATSPGQKLSFATQMTALETAVWPGIYRANISYGLGGGQAASVASSWFLYIAWWHIVELILLAVAACLATRCARLILRRLLPLRTHHPPPFNLKKIIFAWRDAS